MSAPEHTPIPDLVLEQYAVGELEPDELEAIDRRLEHDPALAARLEALRRSNRTILADHPPASFAAEVEARLRAGSDRDDPSPASRRAIVEWRPRWVVLVPVLAAAAILVALFLPSDIPTPGNVLTTPTGIREKGLRPHLNVYRQRGETAELLADSAVTHPGEVLQVAYVAAGATHGVVISIDGNGVVTLHYPSAPAGSTELQATGETPIPHAYRLDEAPDFERFVLVSGATPVRVEDVMGAAEAIANDPEHAREDPLALPGTLQQYSMTILKEVPR